VWVRDEAGVAGDVAGVAGEGAPRRAGQWPREGRRGAGGGGGGGERRKGEGATKGRGASGPRARIAWPALNPVGQWKSRRELFNSSRAVRRPTGATLSPVGLPRGRRDIFYLSSASLWPTAVN
jgi:hypothetical protein